MDWQGYCPIETFDVSPQSVIQFIFKLECGFRLFVCTIPFGLKLGFRQRELRSICIS